MRARLKTMGLSDEAIDAAMKANAGAAKPAAKPETAATPPATVEKPKPVAAAPVAKPAVVAAPVAAVAAPVVAQQPAPAQSEAEAAAAEANAGTTLEVVPDDEPSVDTVPAVVQEPSGAAPDHAEEDPAAADPAAGVTVQNHWSQASGGAVSGDVDRSDFKVPQLKIIQGNSPATVNYSQGDLVFCDQVIFGPPTGDKPSPFMRFVPVQLQKYYREELPKGSKLKPRNVLTKQEVQRLGGTTEWTVDRAGKRVKPTWSPAARITVILEKPETGDHPAFSIPIGDKTYASAVYYVNGGAYRSFAKPIIDSCSFILREGDRIVLEKRFWKMQTIKEQSGEFTVFVPKVALVNEATPPDLRTFAASLRG